MPALESREQEHEAALAPIAHKPSHEEPPTGSGSGPGSGSGSGSGFGSLARKLALLVILAGAGGWGYWKIQQNKQQTADTANRTAQQANRAVPVTAATVVAKTMPIYLTALGTVTAYNTVTVKSRVDGQLMSVNVQEGQHVSQGQVLAMIDPRPYDAAVAQAEGQLAKDQATADYAKAEATRYTALYDAGVVSKDSQQVQTSSAGQSAGVLEADRAAIQAAKVNVAYTKITSPIDGVVGLRQVDAGNIVHAADANGLLVVTQLQPIAVIFTLPEDQLPTVIQTMRGGQTLVVEAYDRSETTHLATGKLLTLDNEIDTTTGTVKAKAVFDNRDGALFPNQFVNIRLILEQRADSLVMPASALQSGASGAFVFLMKKGLPPKAAVDDDGAPVADSGSGGAGGAAGAKAGGSGKSKGGKSGAADAAGGDSAKDAYYVDVQNIVVDLTEGTLIILKSGLKAGDQVIVDGTEKLKKYSKVDPSQARPGGRQHGGDASTQGSGSVEPVQTEGKRLGKGQGNAASAAADAQDQTGAAQHSGGHHGKSAPAGAPK